MSPRGPESHTQPCRNWPNTMKHNDELVIVTVTWARDCDTSQCWWRLCQNAGLHSVFYSSVTQCLVVTCFCWRWPSPFQCRLFVSSLFTTTTQLKLFNLLGAWSMGKGINTINLGVDWDHFLWNCEFLVLGGLTSAPFGKNWNPIVSKANFCLRSLLRA